MAEVASPSTRDEILATALQLFTVQGYDATSLRQIADRLGFTKAALYYHFPAKEDLVIELSRPWLESLSKLVTLSEADLSSGVLAEDERRTRLLSDYLDICIGQHEILRFLSQDAATLRHPDVGKRAWTLIMALQGALAGPEADEADRVRVACAIGAVHAVSTLDSAALAAARPIVVSVAQSVLGIGLTTA